MKIRRTWFLILALLFVVFWDLHLDRALVAIPAAPSGPGRMSRLHSAPTTHHSLANYFRKPRKSSHSGAIRITPMEPAALEAAGQGLEVAWGGRWWPAEIKKTDGERHLIHYLDHGNEWDEWVTDDRIRSRKQADSVLFLGVKRQNLNPIIMQRWLTVDQGADSEFVRLVSLDLAGLPPNGEATRVFVNDPNPTQQKRELWFNELIGNLEVPAGQLLLEGDVAIKSNRAVDLDQDLDLSGRVLLAAAGDQDGDGLADLVVGSAHEPAQMGLHLYFNNGDGRFTVLSAVEPPQPVVHGSPATGDLLVEWGKQWWPAQILKTEGEQHFIHYVGYGPEWDEWVTTGRMGVYSGENQSAPTTP